MSTSRKARGDSTLKTLEDELQRNIFDRLKAKGGTLEKVKAWLFAEFDIKTSTQALSDFFSWYAMKSKIDSIQQRAVDFETFLRKPEFDLSEEQILEGGNKYFLMAATQGEDPKVFEAMAHLFLTKRRDESRGRIEAKKLEINERRVVLLEKKAAHLDAIAAATNGKKVSDLNSEERQALFNLVDEAMGIK